MLTHLIRMHTHTHTHSHTQSSVASEGGAEVGLPREMSVMGVDDKANLVTCYKFSYCLCH